MDRGSRISQVEPDDSVATFQRESGTSESIAEDGIMDTNVGMIWRKANECRKQSHHTSRALRTIQLHQHPDISSQGLVWIPFLSRCKKINLCGCESLNHLLQQSHETGTTPWFCLLSQAIPTYMSGHQSATVSNKGESLQGRKGTSISCSTPIVWGSHCSPLWRCMGERGDQKGSPQGIRSHSSHQRILILRHAPSRVPPVCRLAPSFLWNSLVGTTSAGEEFLYIVPVPGAELRTHPSPRWSQNTGF